MAVYVITMNNHFMHNEQVSVLLSPLSRVVVFVVVVVDIARCLRYSYSWRAIVVTPGD